MGLRWLINAAQWKAKKPTGTMMGACVIVWLTKKNRYEFEKLDKTKPQKKRRL
jgi:hypothetical protein